MTIDEIKKANQEADRHFFDKDTLKFFRSRVFPEVFEGPGGIYFVTSEQFSPSQGPFEARKCSVRRFFPETGEVQTSGRFQAFDSSIAAKKEALRLALGKDQS